MDSAAAALPRRSAWGASSSPSSSVFLLGSAYTLRQDKHVRVDVFYGRLSRQGKAWIDLVGGFVFLLPFCLFGLWTCFPSVMNSSVLP